MQPQEQVTSRTKMVLRFATEADRETIYKLRHQIYAEELRQHNPNLLREELRAGLQHMGIAEVYPGVANFLLCQLPPDGPNAQTIIGRCRQRKLYLRNMGSSVPSLGEHALRIAVKDRQTNATMLQIFQDALR